MVFKLIFFKLYTLHILKYIIIITIYRINNKTIHIKLLTIYKIYKSHSHLKFVQMVSEQCCVEVLGI